MERYTPIFSRIVDSSLWIEPDYVVKVFLTMLAKKDADEVVRGTAFNIASWAKKTEKEVIDALKILSSPDTKRLEPQPFDGRRIEKVEGGWKLLNGAKYQMEMQRINQRRRKTELQRFYRAQNHPLPGEAAYVRGVEAGIVDVATGAPVVPMKAEAPAVVLPPDSERVSPLGVPTAEAFMPPFESCPRPTAPPGYVPLADEGHKAPDKRAEIESLHRVYGEVTKEIVELTFDRERTWFEWMARKFTEVDLRMVVRHLNAGIKQGKRNDGALKFSNLVGRPDLFEEDLAAARKVRGVSFASKPAAPVVHQAPKDPREKSLKEKTPEELASEQEMFRKLRESMAPAVATA
jgi:hypothetical protein